MKWNQTREEPIWISWDLEVFIPFYHHPSGCRNKPLKQKTRNSKTERIPQNGKVSLSSIIQSLEGISSSAFLICNPTRQRNCFSTLSSSPRWPVRSIAFPSFQS